jgi:hypothetical protein
MQLCNLTLRHGGSLLHTIPVVDATPAEILILKSIHGDDSTVDIRPTKMAKTRQEDEWDRLSRKYDQGAAMAAPGDEARSLMAKLFPGAVKKLPISLKEIGLGHLMSPASIKAAEAGTATASAVETPAQGEEVDLTPDDLIPEDAE